MSVFLSHRLIEAPVATVFKAITVPIHLQNWWGPAGFTNTFHVCDVFNGGQWSYTMHGPDGKNYSNESLFFEIIQNKSIVIDHLNNPKYRLILTLTPTENHNQTRVEFKQTFEKPEVAKAIAHIVQPANEQNLDRLAAEVLTIIQYNK